MNIENLKKLIKYNSKEAKATNFNEIVESIYDNIDELISKNASVLTELHKANPIYLSTLSSFKKEEIIALCIEHKYHWPAAFKFKPNEQALADKWSKFSEKSNQMKKDILNQYIEENIQFIKQHSDSSEKEVRHDLYKAKTAIAKNINILSETQIKELLAVGKNVFEFVNDKNNLIKILSKLNPMPFLVFKQTETFIANEYFYALLKKSDKDNLKVIERYCNSPNQKLLVDAIGVTSSAEAIETVLLQIEDIHSMFSKNLPENLLKKPFENPLLVNKLIKSDLHSFIKKYTRIMPQFIFPIIKEHIDFSQHFQLLANNDKYIGYLSQDRDLLVKVLSHSYEKDSMNNAQHYLSHLSIEDFEIEPDIFDLCFDLSIQSPVYQKEGFLVKKENYIPYAFKLNTNYDSDYDSYDSIFTYNDDFYEKFTQFSRHNLHKLDNTDIECMTNVALIQIEHSWAQTFLSHVSYSVIEKLLNNNAEHEFTTRAREFLDVLKERSSLNEDINKTDKPARAHKI